MVAIIADDAHRLLARVRHELAFVFGTSGGALFGLDLITRHSEQVQTLVAHEPPAPGLLPDGARYLAAMEDAYATYRSQGAGPGHHRFLAAAGLTGGPEPGEAGPLGCLLDRSSRPAGPGM